MRCGYSAVEPHHCGGSNSNLHVDADVDVAVDSDFDPLRAIPFTGTMRIISQHCMHNCARTSV